MKNFYWLSIVINHRCRPRGDSYFSHIETDGGTNKSVPQTYWGSGWILWKSREYREAECVAENLSIMPHDHSEEQTDKGGGMGGSCDWCDGVLQEGKYRV